MLTVGQNILYGTRHLKKAINGIVYGLSHMGIQKIAITQLLHQMELMFGHGCAIKKRKMLKV